MAPRKNIYSKRGRPKKPEKSPPVLLAFAQAQRLQIALKLRNIQPPHLATLSGIRKGTILRIKNADERQVGALTTTIFELAVVLQINPGWLAFGDEYCDMLPAKKPSNSLS